MKSTYILLFVLACECLSAAYAADKDQTLHVEIEPIRHTVAVHAKIPVKLIFRNDTKSEIIIAFNENAPMWMQGITFSVDDEKQAKLVKERFVPSIDSDRVGIHPGKTHEITVDLRRFIEIQSVGRIKVSYKARVEFNFENRSIP